MRIYLAGGIQGNLKPLWATVCQLMNSGKEYEEALEEGRKVFLAGVWPWRDEGIYDNIVETYHPYILESFYYADTNTEKLIPYFGDFMLDSGAFTFMGGFSFTSGGKKVKWEEYCEQYADFVNRNHVEKFFELDIDSVEGYDKVKQLRARIERLTNKQSIPVWHSTRGVEEFKRMCDEYPYVALGGIVGGEWRGTAEKYIPWFINEAHKRGAKIHGLGYTKLKELRKYHFDSVDSTAWTTGNRFGYVDKFINGEMKRRQVPQGHRIGKPREAALNNFIEWLKLQKWAEAKL